MITVELWPHGDPEKRRVLGRAKIANDGTGTPTKGNYRLTIFKGRTRAVWRFAKVDGFPRKRLGVWDLLLRSLTRAVGERNSPDVTGRSEEERA